MSFAGPWRWPAWSTLAWSRHAETSPRRSRGLWAAASLRSNSRLMVAGLETLPLAAYHFTSRALCVSQIAGDAVGSAWVMPEDSWR